MFNGKKVVGIGPYAPDFGKTEDRYADKYYFTDTYEVRSKEAGLIPIGVLPVKCFIQTEILDLCDSFIIQGGLAVGPFHLEVIDHALKTGKKVLGICLGCQSIQKYFGTVAEAEKRGYTGPIGPFFEKLQAEGNHSFLKEAKGHYLNPILPRGELDRVKHPVHLDADSHLAKILGTTEVMGASLHYYCIGEPAPGIRVVGHADDGTIEAIEVGETMIGTQFHPDVDGELHQIFDWLAE
ncbi:MAG: gamma-glutamyl-gamma-aminobutyrate hydrolase family protein [Lachnospiraceae bacterium]|nr:gamma-glutamyl-gamma-aminobutyrate hydrolase family protein [Lachnospiraceae bacterium]